ISYQYDLDNDLIFQELKYLTSQAIKEMDEAELNRRIHQRKVNNYNSKKQLYSQEIIFAENIPSDGFRTIYIPHIRTLVPVKAKVEYKYQYDTEQRIIEIELLINENKIWQENYFYRQNEQRPFKLDRYIQ